MSRLRSGSSVAAGRGGLRIAADSRPTGVVSNEQFLSIRGFQPVRVPWIVCAVKVADVADRWLAPAAVFSRVSRKQNVPWREGRGSKRVVLNKLLNQLERGCQAWTRHRVAVVIERARLSLTEKTKLRHRRVEQFEQYRRLAGVEQGRGVISRQWRVHLNPLCCWARLPNGAVDAQGEIVSGSVLLYLDRQRLRGVWLGLEGQVLINELADYQPCTLGEWEALSSLANRANLREFASQLAAVGLVATEPAVAKAA